MGDPIQEAIRELEDEVRQIQQAIHYLRQREARQSVNGTPTTRLRLEPRSTLFGQSDFARLKNEDAINTILKNADRPLTISEIAAEGAKRGKDLNKNSIRWVVGNSDGYRKHALKNTNAKAYSIKEGAEAKK